MKDLEIRGAGNLLGAEQHGNVATVGFHMYTQLLAEAVKTLKGEDVAPPPNAVVDLPLTAFLPASYVDDEKARLSLYSRLATLVDALAVGDLVLELKDRYGELPEPALNLIYLVQLKLLAAAGGILKITNDATDIVLQLPDAGILPAEVLRRKFGSVATVGRTQVRLNRAKMGVNWLKTLQEIVDTFDTSTGQAAPATIAPIKAPLPPVAPPIKRVSSPGRRRSWKRTI